MANKMRYFKVLQGYYGAIGWDDILEVETNSVGSPLNKREGEEFRQDVRAYNDNEKAFRHRVILRRVKVD